MSALGKTENEPELFVMSRTASQIVLVGDDAQWADKLSSLLAAGGTAFTLIRTAAEALQLLHQNPADLVLADMESPEGRELLCQLKEHSLSHVTLLYAFTASEDVATRLRAFELGALDCINKQTDPAVLRARLRAALGMRRRQDELIRTTRS
jgi:DNA-binding response OmpR family regulator